MIFIKGPVLRLITPANHVILKKLRILTSTMPIVYNGQLYLALELLNMANKICIDGLRVQVPPWCAINPKLSEQPQTRLCEILKNV